MKSSSNISVKHLVAIFALLLQLFGQTVGNKNIPVTAVKGESWISHLHKRFSDTSMGKTWHSGPAALCQERNPLAGERDYRTILRREP